jgi:hypothetical protein
VKDVEGSACCSFQDTSLKFTGRPTHNHTKSIIHLKVEKERDRQTGTVCGLAEIVNTGPSIINRIFFASQKIEIVLFSYLCHCGTIFIT